MLVFAILCAAALAGTPEFGVGLRNALEDPGTVDAGRLIGRYRFGSWAVEAALSVRNPLAVDHDGLTSTLVTIAEEGGSGVGFQQPVEYDRFALSLLADLSVAAPSGRGWTGGLHAYGGLEARQVQQLEFTYNADAVAAGQDPATGTDTGTRVQVPMLVTGFGLDAWAGGRVGIRLSLLNRIGVEPDPVYEPSADASDVGSSLHTEVGLALDLLVRP